MTVTGSLALDKLTEAELVECLGAGAVDPEVFAAELDRRERAEQAKRARSDRARAAARQRNSEWEAAAYAQYKAAEEYARGNLLSEAGKRAGRDAWPMCWERGEQDARRLASDELITYWDYVSPRVPGPGAYAASKREAAAEHAARATEPAPISAAEAAELAAMETPAPPAPVAPATPPGSIARYITALGALQRQADRTARALSRVNGGIQR